MGIEKGNFNRLIVILIFLAINTLFISAICNQGQVDINNADAPELDKLVGVGPAIAKNIIDARPYGKLDDLINANGIGAARLEAIKSQGLACVENEEKEGEEENEEKEVKEKKIREDPNEKKEDKKEGDHVNEEINIKSLNEEIKPLEPIVLSAQSIKTQEIKDNYKNKLAAYGFIGFFILIIVLFLLKKNRYKNEFG
jgi:hypothetical protein